jgi:molybdopterin-guanine dinucleotide biosynthesis protein B
MTTLLPPVLCIIGRKNAGKTELTVALAAELKRRGYRVMTVKHGHGFRLDEPGKDSWRHRHEGGVVRTVLASPSGFGVVGDWPEEEMPISELVERFLWDADIVLAEGLKASPEPKIEVFREGGGAGPLFAEEEALAARTVALVTDRPGGDTSIPLFFLGDPAFIVGLADFVEGLFLRSEE